MIVIDASVLVPVLVATDRLAEKVRDRLIADDEWVAPAHWKVEVFSAIRGLTIGGKISEAQGQTSIARLHRLHVESVSLDGLLDPMWQLRSEHSGYDAAYVALAAQRSLTLVTADQRLAHTAVRHCRVELVSGS